MNVSKYLISAAGIALITLSAGSALAKKPQYPISNQSDSAAAAGKDASFGTSSTQGPTDKYAATDAALISKALNGLPPSQFTFSDNHNDIAGGKMMNVTLLDGQRKLCLVYDHHSIQNPFGLSAQCFNNSSASSDPNLLLHPSH